VAVWPIASSGPTSGFAISPNRRPIGRSRRRCRRPVPIQRRMPSISPKPIVSRPLHARHARTRCEAGNAPAPSTVGRKAQCPIGRTPRCSLSACDCSARLGHIGRRVQRNRHNQPPPIPPIAVALYVRRQYRTCRVRGGGWGGLDRGTHARPHRRATG